MKRLFPILTLGYSLFATLPAQATDLTFNDAWIRASSGNMRHSAGYATISNNSDADRYIIAAKIIQPDSLKGMLSIHETVEIDGIFSMRALEDGFHIPAGQTRMFKPKAEHIMLMNLNSKLLKDDKVLLEIQFANGEKQTVSFAVR